MENKWEYDYSNLYNNPNSRPGDAGSCPTDSACANNGPAAAPAQGGAGDVPPSAPFNPGTAPQTPPSPQRPKSSHRWLTRVACLVLAGAVGFGGGVLGARLAGSGNQVVYQTVTRPSADGATGTSTSDTAMNTTNVASLVSPSVVVITTEAVVSSNTWFGGQYVQGGAGSGVVMTADGYILTCAHVVNGASSINVTLADGTEYPATLVGADTQSDVGVIKIDAANLVPAVMGNSDALAVGESVLAVGNPMGKLGGTVSQGIVSALNREISVNNNTMTVIQTDASVSPGNSGGGLFNANGDLIGIVNAKSSSTAAEGIGFAIPVNTALSVAQDLIESGYVTGRPAMGISVVTINDAQKAAQYGVSSYGVYVAAVNEGSGAEAAGMKVGDLFVSVDNTIISTNSDLTDIIAQHSVGDTVTVQLSRDRQLITMDVVLGESAAPVG